MDCDAYPRRHAGRPLRRRRRSGRPPGRSASGRLRRLPARDGRACAGCAGDLAQWRLPETLRGTARGRAAAAACPVGLAAAAALILGIGAGLGLAGAEMRHDGGGVSLRVGRGARRRAPWRRWSSAIAPRSPPCARSSPPRARPTSGSSWRTVAGMIRESEMRQEEARLDTARVLRRRAGRPAAIRPRAHERGPRVPRRQGRAAGGAHHRARRAPPPGLAAEVAVTTMTPSRCAFALALLLAAAPTLGAQTRPRPPPPRNDLDDLRIGAGGAPSRARPGRRLPSPPTPAGHAYRLKGYGAIIVLAPRAFPAAHGRAAGEAGPVRGPGPRSRTRIRGS